MKFGEKLRSVEEYRPFPYAGQVRLDANESGYGVPDAIKQQMIEAVSQVEFNRYPDPDAKELCRAFASYYGVKPENVVAGNGSDELLSIVFGGILSDRDRVMVTAPDFSMYRIYGETYGRRVEVFRKSEDLSLDVRLLCDAVREKGITFLIFSNPCNPTGLQVSEKDIAFLLEKAGCTVCVDEAYMDFSSGSVMNLIEKYPHLIVLKTMSKNIGFAAGRIGFAVSSADHIAAFKKAKSPYNLNSMSQAAGTVLFRNGDYLKSVAARLTESRKRLQTALEKFSGEDFSVYPSNANFVYIKTSRAAEYYRALLEKNIVIRCFGSDHLRITAGTEEENALLVKALSDLVSSPKKGVDLQ